jgi:hypothetical protein
MREEYQQWARKRGLAAPASHFVTKPALRQRRAMHTSAVPLLVAAMREKAP